MQFGLLNIFVDWIDDVAVSSLSSCLGDLPFPEAVCSHELSLSPMPTWIDPVAAKLLTV